MLAWAGDSLRSFSSVIRGPDLGDPVPKNNVVQVSYTKLVQFTTLPSFSLKMLGQGTGEDREAERAEREEKFPSLIIPA